MLKTYIRILSYVKPYWKHLSLSIICTILFAVLNGLSVYLAIPLLSQLFNEQKVTVAQTSKPETKSSLIPDFVNKAFTQVSNDFNNFIFSGDKSDVIVKICFLILLAFFLKNLFGYLQTYFLAYVEQNFVKDFRDDAFVHLHKLPMSYFKNEQTGQLISRLTNDVTVAHSVSAVFFNLIREPLTILVFLSIAFLINWWLTAFALLILPFSFIIINLVGTRIRRQSLRLQEKMAGITTILEETINGVKIVKAFGMEEYENEKFKKETTRYSNIIVKMVRVRNAAPHLTEFLGSSVGVILIYFGGVLVLKNHEITASEFLGFLFAILQILQPIKELSSVNNRIQEASAGADRIFEILDTEPSIKNIENPVDKNDFEKNIEFNNVSFSYVDSVEKVLDSINFSVSKGQIIALVGSSGAGKTTLVDLIPRFYDPTEGSVMIDGTDIRQMKIENLRGLMGIVTQETLLFNETVMNNIAYGLKNYPEEKIIAVAKAANAHDFIMELPNGYNTMIGEKGMKLSGGQRQRLAIARALLKNPPIMIFDEATSALDNESEALVQEAIERMMVNRTTFVIAHRLSTIKNANRIFVLDKGTIVQEGKHDELLEDENGIYKRLYELQFREKIS